MSVSAHGAYVVAYRVVSSDGHPVSDQVGFTYTGPGVEAVEPSAAGSTGPTPEAAASQDADSGSNLALWWPLIAEVAVITALALGLQLLVLLVLRRKRGVTETPVAAGPQATRAAWRWAIVPPQERSRSLPVRSRW